MRHRNKGNALSRKTAHRTSMLSNMACSLIEHKRITTTVAKAKELRSFVEPLITKSKTDSTHSRRIVFSRLKQKDAVSSLFRDVAPKVAEREGGYTRIIRLGTRQGDAAEMCMMELVDFNELLLADSKTKTRRSRRGGKKKSSDTTSVTEAKSADAAATAAEAKAEPAAPEAAASAETAEAPETKEAPEAKDAPKASKDTEAKEASAEEKKPKAETSEDAPEASKDDKNDSEDADKKDKA